MRKAFILLSVLFCHAGLLAQTSINDSIRYYYYFAYAQFNAVGDDEEAVNTYSRILRLDPKDDEAVILRARCRMHMKDYAGAEKDYTRVLQLDPGSIAAMYGRAEARALQKKYADAISDNDLMIRLEPTNPSYYTNRGLNKVHLKDFAGACEDFETAKSLGGVYAAVLIKQYCQELY